MNTYADDLGMLVGWGKINDTSAEYSTVPRKIEVTIIPYLSCALSYLFKVQMSQICTTGLQEGKNICLGDSGSPLVVNGTQVSQISQVTFNVVGGYVIANLLMQKITSALLSLVLLDILPSWNVDSFHVTVFICHSNYTSKHLLQ